jgi:hypothetical protein
MKKRLIILSDLWGKSSSNWESLYINKLNNDFEIQYYDCCELGNIDKTVYSENHLHQQFINNGIDVAVKKLLALEKEAVSVLAFSIGGTIAWKATLEGLCVNTIVALSATRLRYENEKPNCTIQLLYGANDSFRPTEKWFEEMNISPQILTNKTHNFYQSYLDFESIF